MVHLMISLHETRQRDVTQKCRTYITRKTYLFISSFSFLFTHRSVGISPGYLEIFIELDGRTSKKHRISLLTIFLRIRRKYDLLRLESPIATQNITILFSETPRILNKTKGRFRQANRIKKTNNSLGKHSIAL